MRNSPGAPTLRSGGLFAKRLTAEEAWNSPPAKSEAAHCLAVARANGGIERMRELIAINDQEKAELASWAAEQPELTGRIIAAVAYREQVLGEFDRLAGQDAERSRTPFCQAS